MTDPNYKCHKCGCEIDTDKGQILIVYPVFFKGNFLPFVLCRPHFLEADKMTAAQFRIWVHKKEGKP